MKVAARRGMLPADDRIAGRRPAGRVGMRLGPYALAAGGYLVNHRVFRVRSRCAGWPLTVIRDEAARRVEVRRVLHLPVPGKKLRARAPDRGDPSQADDRLHL